MNRAELEQRYKVRFTHYRPDIIIVDIPDWKMRGISDRYYACRQGERFAVAKPGKAGAYAWQFDVPMSGQKAIQDKVERWGYGPNEPIWLDIQASALNVARRMLCKKWQP